MADSMGQFRLGTAIIKRLVGAPKATTTTKLERERRSVYQMKCGKCGECNKRLRGNK